MEWLIQNYPLHPLHMKYVAKFLSLNVFQYLGTLTFTIYIIHYRVLFDMIFYWLPPHTIDKILLTASEVVKTGSLSVIGSDLSHQQVEDYQRGFGHVFVLAMSAYVVTILLAVVVHNVVEKPLHRVGSWKSYRINYCFSIQFVLCRIGAVTKQQNDFEHTVTEQQFNTSNMKGFALLLFPFLKQVFSHLMHHTC